MSTKEYYQKNKHIWRNYYLRDREKRIREAKECKKKNPERYKHYARIGKVGREYLRAYERDNYQCQDCGMTNTKHIQKFKSWLTLHHKDGKGRNLPREERNNRPDNLVTLCLPCHGKRDSLKNRDINQFGKFKRGESRRIKTRRISKILNVRIKPIKNISQVGERNPNWNGGKKMMGGYVGIRNQEHPRNINGYVYEHILVMEQFLGKPLKWIDFNHSDNEIVHHKNKDKQDNRLENLQLMTHGENIALHNKMRDYSNILRNEKGQFVKKSEVEVR